MLAQRGSCVCSWCELIHGTRCWGRLGQDQNVQLEPQLPLPHKREKKSGMLWGSKIDRADRSFTSAKHSCKWVTRPSRNFWRIPLWNSCFMASEVWISWVLSWTLTSFDPWSSSTLWWPFSAVILLKTSLVDLAIGLMFARLSSCLWKTFDRRLRFGRMTRVSTKWRPKTVLVL